MFKKLLIFGAGTLFGAYAMYNHLYKKITIIAINHKNDTSKEESKTSETEKES